MGVSYNRLWKMLIDLKMTKTELRLRSGISSVSLAKLGKDENLTVAVLMKICRALKCNFGDIMDIVPDEEEENAKKL